MGRHRQSCAQDRVADARDGVLLTDVGAAKEIGPVHGRRDGPEPRRESEDARHVGGVCRRAGRSASQPLELPVGPLDLAASAAVSVRRGGRVSPAGGVELGYMPIDGVIFAGRVGARLPEKNAEAPITLGAIFTFDRVSIDYGVRAVPGRRQRASRRHSDPAELSSEFDRRGIATRPDRGADLSIRDACDSSPTSLALLWAGASLGMTNA